MRNGRVGRFGAYSLRTPENGNRPYRTYTHWGNLESCREALPDAAHVHDYFHRVKNQRDNARSRRGGKLRILGMRTM